MVSLHLAGNLFVTKSAKTNRRFSISPLELFNLEVVDFGRLFSLPVKPFFFSVHLERKRYLGYAKRLS